MGNLFEGLHDRTTDAFNELRPCLDSDYVALGADYASEDAVFTPQQVRVPINGASLNE
jgi:hypothetical protein